MNVSILINKRYILSQITGTLFIELKFLFMRDLRKILMIDPKEKKTSVFQYFVYHSVINQAPKN